MPEIKSKPGLASLVSRPLLAGIVAAGAAAPIAAPAAGDIFLMLDGIPGESTDAKHKGEIDVLSYSQSFTNPASASERSAVGASAGRVNCGDVKVTKEIDRSSPSIIGAVATGKHIPKAVITFRKAGENLIEYYKVTLTDVLIDSINQIDASALDSARILERISISSSRFEFEYRPQKADGSVGEAVTFGWDCAANRAF